MQCMNKYGGFTIAVFIVKIKTTMTFNHITADDLDTMPTRIRTNFVNALSGCKSANVIGTIHPDGTPNAALFSSVVHLGADPALMGMVVRPNVVPRHTLDNIHANQWFTINHVSQDWYQAAHATSARTDQSEFELTGLTAHYEPNIPAPFVHESSLRIALTWVRTMDIPENGTHFVIGRVQHVWVPSVAQRQNGDIDIAAIDTVAVTGLYTYHAIRPLDTLPYAKASL